MNNQLSGAIHLFHDYALINKGLEQIIKHSALRNRLQEKNSHPVEEFAERAIFLCGLDSVHKFTFKGEIHPLLSTKNCKIIVLIDACAKVDLSTLMNMGVKGIICTDISALKLLEIIDIIDAGGVFISSKLSFDKGKTGFDKVRENVFFKKLTERELEVLKCITDEMTNKEIAKALFISPRTVETHRRNLIQKLKVKSSVGLVKAFFKTG